jgi:transcriptional regulator with XRE-family HTH domain
MSAFPMVAVSGARLAECRKQLGLTQSGLGKATGLPRGRISEIELGHPVSFDTLRRYVAGLGGQVEIVARVGGLWLTVTCVVLPVDPGVAQPGSAPGEALEGADRDVRPGRVPEGRERLA